MKKILLFVGLILSQIFVIGQNYISKTIEVPKFLLSKSDVLLFDQTDNISTSGFVTQDFVSSANDAYDSFLADDFTVSGTWDINYIWAPFFMSDTTNPAPIEKVNVFFYQDNNGIPGQEIASFTNIDCNFKDNWLYIPLTENVTLSDGTYWICLQPRYAYADGGIVYWVANNSNNGNQFVWKNPGDGFQTGYTDWTDGYTAFETSINDLTLLMLNSTPNNINTYVSFKDKPLVGANVKIFNQSKNTDSTGFANFQIYTGSYYIYVSHACIYDAEIEIDINQDMDLYLNNFQGQPYEVTFVTVDQNGNLIPNVSITVNNTTIQTNNYGYGTMQLECDDYTYTATKDGYPQITGNFTVAGANKNITVCMDCITNVKSDSQINIYPNPTDGDFYVSNAQNYYFELIDLSGKTVQKGYINSADYKINIKTKGNYILKLQNNEQIKSFKVIVK